MSAKKMNVKIISSEDMPNAWYVNLIGAIVECHSDKKDGWYKLTEASNNRFGIFNGYIRESHGVNVDDADAWAMGYNSAIEDIIVHLKHRKL